MHMIVITGATGQFGPLVIASLLVRIARQIVAATRTPSSAPDLAALGVDVREADHGNPATLAKALAGATSVLLISSPGLGIRDPVATEQDRAASDVPWVIY
jgi:NAD(P)H dehydrogenase (quinone)